MECIFCKIAKKEIPSKVLYEDDLVMVIMDVNPAVDGHALVIPKKHVEDYVELDEKTLQHIFDVAKKLGPKMMKKLNVSALTLLINYGDSQQVKHFHLHLLPNYKKDAKLKHSIEENYEQLKEI